MTTREENLRRAGKIERHVRPLTLPVGVRLWKKGERVPSEAGKRPDKTHSWCQFLTLARTNASDDRPTFLIRKEDFACPIASHRSAPGVRGSRIAPPHTRQAIQRSVSLLLRVSVACSDRGGLSLRAKAAR